MAEQEQEQQLVWVPPSAGQPEQWGQLLGHSPQGGSIVRGSWASIRRLVPGAVLVTEQALWIPPDLPGERWGTVLAQGSSAWLLVIPATGERAALAIAAGSYWAS